MVNWQYKDKDFTEEQIEKAQQDAVEDTVFVINNFMEHFNTYMMFEAEKKSLIK